MRRKPMFDTRGRRAATVVLGSIVVAAAAVSGSGQQQSPPSANTQTPTGLAPARPAPKILDDYKPVTAERLKHPEDSDWLMVRRTYDGWGYSPLDQITTANVAKLQPVWMMSTGMNNGHQ